jgi:hypothetical protein
MLIGIFGDGDMLIGIFTPFMTCFKIVMVMIPSKLYS